MITFNTFLLLNPILIICLFHVYLKQFVWKIGIIGSCFNLVGGLVFWLCLDPLSLDFQFYTEFIISIFSPPYGNYIEEFLSDWIFAIDGLSLLFLLLTKIIFVCCIYYSCHTVSFQQRMYVTLLFLIDFFLSASFLTINLFIFYILFESLLIPMYLLIGIWGGRSRKIRAAYFLVMYTVVFSFFLLFALFYVYLWYGTYNFTFLNYFLKLQIMTISLPKEIFLWAFFFLAFAAKLPIFPFHIWLPEAHVEAPTVGSVILASLLLKLGGYGIIRFLLLTLSTSVNYYFLNVYLIIALLSCIYTTFIAARQVDIKKIIAYSSIAHMNLTLLGLFSNSVIGVTGAVSLMLAHGFVSGALFFSVGMLYSRFNTRLLKYYSGITSIVPKLSIFFLFFSFANIGFPCTYNFIGELLILLGFFLNTAVSIGLLVGIAFVTSLVYSIWIFNKIFFGGFSAYLEVARDISFFEIWVLSCLGLLTLYFGVNPYLINEILLPVIEKI